MESAITVLLYWLLAGFFFLVVLLILRALMLWYWRINEMADNIAYIANHYRRIDQDAGRQITNKSGQTGAGSPFASMGNR